MLKAAYDDVLLENTANECVAVLCRCRRAFTDKVDAQRIRHVSDTFASWKNLVE